MGLRDRYEAHHRVNFTNAALEEAVELSVRYINNRFLPDKAIDVMDEAGARVRLKNMVAPPDLKEVNEEIEHLDRSKEEAVHNQEFEKAASLRDKAYQLRKAREEQQKEWRAQQSVAESSGTVDVRGHPRDGLQDDRRPVDAAGEGRGRATPAHGRGAGPNGHSPESGDRSHRALGATLAVRPEGPASPDGFVHIPRPFGRREDLPLQAAREVHVR